MEATRYDLDNGIETLDLESVMELTKLADHWNARARLRARWASRTLTGVPAPRDTRPEQTNIPFDLTRRVRPLSNDDLGLLIRGGKTLEQRYEEARSAL